MEEGSKNAEIEKYALAIKEMAPHKIMVPVGYEPDLYVNELNEDNPEKARGTPEDYKAMWRNFVRIFNDNEVENVVWVMDYSYEIRLNPQLAVELWPENNVVSWLMFNVFQFTKIIPADTNGDCPLGFDFIYQDFMSKIEQIPEWEDMPWALGAWGTNGNNKWLPMDDRRHCLDEMRLALESGDYPKIRAAISFNSLGSRIDDDQSPELLPNFYDLMDSSAFYE